MLDSLVLGVAGMNLFAVLLVLGRSWGYRTRLYRPMLLNIGLSVAPLVALLVGLALTLVTLVGTTSSPATWAVGVVSGLVWLLLLPNSSYLITELNLSHRVEDDPVPLWYDIVLVLTLAMSGVLNMVVNTLVVQLIYAVVRYGDEAGALSRTSSQVLAVLLIAICAVGVYLGRYLRLNSWDVRHPASFWRKVRTHFSTAAAWRTFGLFTLLHTIFIALVYLVVAGTVISALQAVETR